VVLSLVLLAVFLTPAAVTPRPPSVLRQGDGNDPSNRAQRGTIPEAAEVPKRDAAAGGSIPNALTSSPKSAPSGVSQRVPETAAAVQTRRAYDRARDGDMRIAISGGDDVVIKLARPAVRDRLRQSGATYESATASATHQLRLETTDSMDNSVECGGWRFVREISYAIVGLSNDRAIAQGSVTGTACYSSGRSKDDLAYDAAEKAIAKLAAELNVQISQVAK
jgi:hypothetical protein